MARAIDDEINSILNDKAIKAKGKVSSVSQLLVNDKVAIRDLIAIAENANDINKATIIEAVEFATKTKAEVLNDEGFEFVVACLRSAAPRVKWESAKVIANTAHLFPHLLKKAIVPLLDNTEHQGSVVRWSTAGALSKIILCKTDLNSDLIPAVEAIEKREEDHAIKKIYQQALKRPQKTVFNK